METGTITGSHGGSGTRRATYVQENVRGLDMDRSDDDPLYPTGPPRVVRYGTTLVALARRASEETRGLAGC